MDRKTLQKQIDYFKRELLALKSPQGEVTNVNTYYYEMYETVPGQGINGTYTIYYSTDSEIIPITIKQKTYTGQVTFGKYDEQTHSQRLFIMGDSTFINPIITSEVLLSTREIISVVKD